MSDVAAADPTDMASHLAAKLCHDFINPVGAIITGLDLMDEPDEAMKAEAIKLIADSAGKLREVVEFARVAFGASASVERFSSDTLKALAETAFSRVRPTMDWAVALPELGKPAAKALLNLAQLGAGLLPAGGVARVGAQAEAGGTTIVVEAGPKARLHPDTASGLRGEPRGEAIGGRWIQAYYLHAVVSAAGGALSAEVVEDRVTLTAFVPD